MSIYTVCWWIAAVPLLPCAVLMAKMSVEVFYEVRGKKVWWS